MMNERGRILGSYSAAAGQMERKCVGTVRDRRHQPETAESAVADDQRATKHFAESKLHVPQRMFGEPRAITEEFGPYSSPLERLPLYDDVRRSGLNSGVAKGLHDGARGSLFFEIPFRRSFLLRSTVDSTAWGTGQRDGSHASEHACRSPEPVRHLPNRRSRRDFPAKLPRCMGRRVEARQTPTSGRRSERGTPGDLDHDAPYGGVRVWRSYRRNRDQSDALSKIGGAGATTDDQPLEQCGIFGQGLLESGRRGILQSRCQGRHGRKGTRSETTLRAAQLEVEAVRRCVVSRAAKGRLGRLAEQLLGLATRAHGRESTALEPIPVDKAVERPRTRRRRPACASGPSNDSRMRLENGLCLVRVQNPSAGPRHVDATSKLIHPFSNRADSFRCRRPGLEVPQVKNRSVRIEETGTPLLADPDFAHSRRVAADRIQVVVRHEQLDGPPRAGSPEPQSSAGPALPATSARAHPREGDWLHGRRRRRAPGRVGPATAASRPHH